MSVEFNGDVGDGKAASAGLRLEGDGAPGNATREIFDAGGERDRLCKTPEAPDPQI